MIDPIELEPASKASPFKVIRMPVGSRKQVVFRLTDEKGAPVDLRTEPVNAPAPAPEFHNEPKVSDLTVAVKLRAKGAYSDGQPIFEINGKLVDDACNGIVSFELLDEATARAGVFIGEVGRFVSGNQLVDTWPVYIAIEPSVFELITGAGPLTIPEVRLGLNDFGDGEISLLDDMEFEDVQILYAIRQVVDLWNESLPPVRTYTTQNFPFRYHWIKGTMAKLYAMAAKKYLRNQLNYQAGGITIDDQNKYEQYIAISEKLMEEFKEWMLREKIRQNMERAWSTGL